MIGINIFYAVLISIGFIFVNLAFKFLSLFVFGSVLINIFPSSSHLAIYAAATIAIIISGLLIGKFIHVVIARLPLYHALAVALLASAMKSRTPEYNEVSTTAQVFFVALTFISIMYGAYVFRKKHI